jgi:hypothetical protein
MGIASLILGRYSPEQVDKAKKIAGTVGTLLGGGLGGAAAYGIGTLISNSLLKKRDKEKSSRKVTEE